MNIEESILFLCYCIDLVYAGRCLQDDNSLEWYGVQSGATVLVLKKVVKDVSPCSKPGICTLQLVHYYV